MEGAFEAMGDGTVDVNWAKEHHSLWLEEEQATGPHASPPPAARLHGCRRRRYDIRYVRSTPGSPASGSRGAVVTCYNAPHAHHRPRRLERLRQDHAAHQGDPACSSRAGLRVSTLKHAHHDFDIDQPGKDSACHRMAGATEVLVGSGRRWALDARVARRAGADARRLAREDDARSISWWSKATSASAIPSSKSIARRSASRCCIPDDPAIVAIASDAPLPQAQCRWSISTTSRASPTCFCATRCRVDRVPADAMES